MLGKCFPKVNCANVIENSFPYYCSHTHKRMPFQINVSVKIQWWLVFVKRSELLLLFRFIQSQLISTTVLIFCAVKSECSLHNSLYKISNYKANKWNVTMSLSTYFIFRFKTDWKSDFKMNWWIIFWINDIEKIECE